MHPKPKREGYKYHIFISYSRSGDVPERIRNHFLPVLANQLDGLLNEEPEIFVDYSIDIGTKWPDILCEALQRSRCLLSVWTLRYFRSGWCLVVHIEQMTPVPYSVGRAGCLALAGMTNSYAGAER